MIRNALTAIALAAPLIASAARAEDPTPAVARCIADNATQVEAAITSLTDATDFLLNNVCASVVAEEQRQRQAEAMQKWTTDLRKKCDAKRVAGQSTKVGAGEDSYDFCAASSDDQESAQGYSSWTIFAGKQSADPDATSLAAKTLLRIRLSHATSAQPR